MRGYKMEMRMYAFLLFLVGCWGTEWKTIEDFKETFMGHSVAATDTITSIEKILDTSRKQSELFLNNIYSNKPVVNRVTEMRLSEDKCFAKFIDEENLKFSFQIQNYQLQIPLNNRIVDIRERLNNINASIDIYEGIAESKFRSCKSLNGSCLEETNQWLESKIISLSCALYPNCSNHSIRKRSICSSNEFMCRNGDCISSNYFCDRGCDCGDCSDEFRDCTKSCSEFRCSETFRCIPYDRRCNGIDDCGDGTDEDGCPPPSTPTPSYTHANCSIAAGDFFCRNMKCIGLEKVCDSHNDCGDWSDEGDHCKGGECSVECGRKGEVCFTGPQGSECLYECPPGTYETPEGCSRNPEAPLPTLIQVLEDTPRLITRYVARLKFLKTKTMIVFSKALREVVRCKKEEFTLLSKIIDFSTIIHEEGNSPRIGLEIDPAIPETSVDLVAGTTETQKPLTVEITSIASTEETISEDYS